MAMSGVRKAKRGELPNFVGMSRRQVAKQAQQMGVMFNSETPTLAIVQRMNAGFSDLNEDFSAMCLDDLY